MTVLQHNRSQGESDDDCGNAEEVPGGRGSIQTGFGHAVAVVMATRSFREGKKLYWDRKTERIVDRPVLA